MRNVLLLFLALCAACGDDGTVGDAGPVDSAADTSTDTSTDTGADVGPVDGGEDADAAPPPPPLLCDPAVLPGTIYADLSLSGCTVQAEGDVFVAEAATLILSDGARVEMGTEAKIYVGPGRAICTATDCAGRLVATGTEASPVVFTSAAASPAPGDWASVSLANVLPGTILDHVLVEYGSSETNRGALHIVASGTAPPSITNTTFRRNRSVGVFLVSNSSDPVVFDDNTFRETMGRGLMIGLREVATLSTTNVFERSVTVFAAGNILDAVTWPVLDVPFRIDGDLLVGHASVAGGPSLTLSPGTTVRFDRGAELVVVNAMLVADGVAFQAAQPGAGMWGGDLVLRQRGAIEPHKLHGQRREPCPHRR